MTSADGAEPSAPPTRPRRSPLHRGAEGSWLWALQRITGAMVFAYVLMFAVTVSLMRVSPDAFNRVIRIYQNPLVTILEVALIGAVLFHALNGLRVMVLDRWSRASAQGRTAGRVVVVVWLALFLPAAYLMLSRTFLALFGQLP